MNIDDKLNVSETLLSQLYNREYKELFLKEYLEDDNTRETYVVFLIQAASFEKLIEKDLYNFSSTDVIDMFANQFTSSHASLRALFSISKQYVNWGVNRGLNRTGTNVFNTLNFKKDILGMLNKKGLQNKYLTEEQIWEVINGREEIIDGENKIIGGSKNYQDSVCIILPFYGIKGSRNIELINLKKEDIDVVNNKVKLVTEIDETTDQIISTRVVSNLPKKVIDLILRAWGEVIYHKYGNLENVSRDYVELVNSNYVLKVSTIGKRDDSDKVKPQTIATRAKKLLTAIGYDDLSINDIYMAGKIHMLNKLKEQNENKELSIDDFRLVQMEFGDDSKNYNNLRELYSQLAISKAD